MMPLTACLIVAATGLPAQRVVSRGMAVDSNVALRVWIPAGSVEVRSWDRDSVDVLAELTSKVVFSGGGGRTAAKFAVEFADPQTAGLPNAKLTMRVPKSAKVWIKSTTASVVVVGGDGQLDVLTVTGSTDVRDLASIATIESIDGTVAVKGATGHVRVRAGSGHVFLDGLTGTVDISTVGGEVRFNTVVGPDSALPGGKVETVGGGVWVTGRLADGASLGVETHSGNITLRRVTGNVLTDTFKGEINAGAPDGI